MGDLCSEDLRKFTYKIALGPEEGGTYKMDNEKT
jgi:hypothetical protein